MKNPNNTEPLMGSAVILTKGLFALPDAKTAHGLIRGTDRFKVLAVIDGVNAGKDAGAVMDGIHRGIPIFSDVDACMAALGEKPDYAVIGVALSGGRLDSPWQALALDMLQRGISLVSGMHMFLGDDPLFRRTALENNATIIDVRRPLPREQYHFWSGDIYKVTTPKIAVLGSDCALGKRTTAGMIVNACAKTGIDAEMIYTGQTGWLQGSPYGFILDTTVNDFVSGEIEAAIVRCEKEARPDLIVVEGQSALRNPLGPCGSEIIVSGNVKGVILQHAPFRECFDTVEDLGCRLPTLGDEIRLIEMYGTRVIAVALNSEKSIPKTLEHFRSTAQKQLGIPVVLPLEASVDALIPVLAQFIKDHDRLPDTCRRTPGGHH
jgi:uncharacterized NAD-dependent epimerase/dehydratase family protein